MAHIEEKESKGKGGKRTPKKYGTSIDMTPMVDLMCLLITFFMLTTAFSKPKVMEITMPEKTDTPEEIKDQTKIAAERTLNILITGDDEIYYYIGLANINKPPLPTLVKSDFSEKGIRAVLLEKNANVFRKVAELKDKVIKGELVMADTTLNRMIKDIKREDKKAPIVLIKADEKAKYRDVVNIIDEMAICNIAQYAVVDIAPVELKMLETAPR